MNDKEIQVSTEELIVNEQPRSNATVSEKSPLVPIEAKSHIKIDNSCNNCNCCVFSFGGK